MEKRGRPRVTAEWKSLSIPIELWEKLDERRQEDQAFWRVIKRILEGAGRSHPTPSRKAPSENTPQKEVDRSEL